MTLLSDFLRKEVGLPSTYQLVASGPRDLCYDIFLSTAGGIPAMEAEVKITGIYSMNLC